MTVTRFILELMDIDGEHPLIFVRDSTSQDLVIEFLLVPIPLVEKPDSHEDGHWDFPEFCKQTVALMNEYA